jgi:hypothetical protein
MYNYSGRTIYMGIDVHKNSYSVSVMCDKVVVKKAKMVGRCPNFVKLRQSCSSTRSVEAN